jgi:hypothetical protein
MRIILLVFVFAFAIANKAFALSVENVELLALESPGRLIQLEYVSTDEEDLKQQHIYGDAMSKMHRYCQKIEEEVRCSPSRGEAVSTRYVISYQKDALFDEAQSIYRMYVEHQKRSGASIGTFIGFYVCSVGCGRNTSKVLVYVAHGD